MALVALWRLVSPAVYGGVRVAMNDSHSSMPVFETHGRAGSTLLAERRYPWREVPVFLAIWCAAPVFHRPQRNANEKEVRNGGLRDWHLRNERADCEVLTGLGRLRAERIDRNCQKKRVVAIGVQRDSVRPPREWMARRGSCKAAPLLGRDPRPWNRPHP